MKFAAIKGQMGNWKYYVTTLSFKDVCDSVSPITNEISNSDSYSNLLQRTITNNVESIKDYLIRQPERFFNALVLAVYDGNPEWYELDVEVEEYSTFSVGVLELKGDEIIFPVDGQHRVAGIKEAVEREPSLENEKVPIILIGHEDSFEGKKRTRRLFSTLNRRAKRVEDNEIIALDEDDVVAIATREIAENNELFAGNRLIDAASKNIQSSNQVAFTSILALYECNKLIYNSIALDKGMKKKEIKEYLLYRPSDDEVDEFVYAIDNFWVMMSDKIEALKTYMSLDEENIAKHNFRNKDGGNLLFRPLGLAQFVNAILDYKKRTNASLEDAIYKFGKISMIIEEKPWKNILWLDNKRINGRISKADVFRLIMFMVDEKVLKDSEKNLLISSIAVMRNIDITYKDEILDELRKYTIQNY